MYDFKKLEEAGWYAAGAAGIAVLVALASLDPTKMLDWKTWLIALGGAAIRAAAGGMLAFFGKG